MSFPQPETGDERRHPAGDEQLWGESWYFDYSSLDGSTGGYVRLGLYPNLGVAWYWACLVREGQPTLAIVDHEIAIPASPTSLQVRGEGIWADHTCEEPLERWSLGLEGFALAVDDPTELYRTEPLGERVPFGFELDWETDGTPFKYQITERYEIPCRVHGKVIVGDQAIEIDGVGQRDHSWGVRDWWAFPWVWSAFHANDGAHLFGNWVPIMDEFIFMTGYHQGGPGAVEPVATDEFVVHFVPGADGLVSDVSWELLGHQAQIETVAWAPVMLRSPEGKESHFARALCRAKLADGRTAVGWMEFNQPASPG